MTAATRWISPSNRFPTAPRPISPTSTRGTACGPSRSSSPFGRVASLGEGFTPLVDANGWDAQFKLDCVFPSGSFKDRGATTTLSRAAELGVETVLEDSSGNAGAAIAQYAARAGIDAEIYVPADAKASKLKAIECAGATPVRIEGSRQDVTDACIEAVENGDGWYASHAWNPAFFAGTMTFALELAAQRDWNVPDAVVTPLGHGTLFLGAYRGFRALLDAGWTDSMPRLLGVQAEGVSPIADGFHDDRGDADGPRRAQRRRRRDSDTRIPPAVTRFWTPSRPRTATPSRWMQVRRKRHSINCTEPASTSNRRARWPWPA